MKKVVGVVLDILELSSSHSNEMKEVAGWSSTFLFAF